MPSWLAPSLLFPVARGPRRYSLSSKAQQRTAVSVSCAASLAGPAVSRVAPSGSPAARLSAGKDARIRAALLPCIAGDGAGA
jgi:hypothetical protein